MTSKAEPAPIYVVVCQNGKPSRYNGKVDPYGPLVFESYTSETMQQAQAKAARLEREYGPCRVGRVVFDDDPQFSPKVTG
ncbi:MAG TPA: hypothetical protein VN680_00190 [Burkholderiaceae bacterium]|nr:hypothetical protein [Burkholderiaceae bacterium]